MKIGILYICTGNYTVFWDDFYLSCEKNFLSDKDRFYFVFTDGKINTYDNPRIKVIPQNKLGWPFDTLKRFNMFLSIKEELIKMDYLFFFNANVIVEKEIQEKDVLPTETQEVTVVQHPSYYDYKDPAKFPYDRNPDSLAYIPLEKGKVYVQGAFNGGKADKFIYMCSELNKNTEDDLARNVIALWHDESHLNRYILDKEVLLLNPGYICPEGRKLPFETKMYTRKKKKYGGHNALRGIEEKSTLKSKIFRLFGIK